MDDRRLSHIFLMEVKDYPRLLFITDAAINISPDLEDKRDVLQNAIDMVQVMGLSTPQSRDCLCRGTCHLQNPLDD